MHRHLYTQHTHAHTCTCRHTCPHKYTCAHTGNTIQRARAPDRRVSACVWPAPHCPRYTSTGGICTWPRMKTQGREAPDYDSLFEGFPCCSQEGVLGSGSSHLFLIQSPRRGRVSCSCTVTPLTPGRLVLSGIVSSVSHLLRKLR